MSGKGMLISLLTLAVVFVLGFYVVNSYTKSQQEDESTKGESNLPEKVDHVARIARKFEISPSDAAVEVQELFQAVSGNTRTKATQEFLEQLEDGNPSMFVAESAEDLRKITASIGKSNVAKWREKLHSASGSLSRLQISAASCSSFDLEFLSALELAASLAELESTKPAKIVASQLPFFTSDDVKSLRKICAWLAADKEFGHLKSLEIELPSSPSQIVDFSRDVSRMQQQIQRAIREQLKEAKKTNPESEFRKIEDLVIDYEAMIDCISKLAN